MASMVVLQLGGKKKDLFNLELHNEGNYFKSKHMPVSRRLGQFVLRFPVMRVQSQHEASSAQLGL